ncbi:MAG: peptidoglycan editing factor PgeF [Bacteroidota bacterium]
MKKIRIGDLELWQFDNLENEQSIKHFVTDRGTTQAGKEFTLSLSSLPDKEEVWKNRGTLAQALGIPVEKLYLPSQVHKTRIVNVTAQTSKAELVETDALVTNKKGLCIAVMSADCVPILLYDTKNQAIGAVHSGWRGTVAKILEKTLLQMHVLFGTRGEHVVAGIGPSVSQESYEVGEEVVNEIDQTFGRERELMIAKPNNKANLDLWKANKIQLLEFGVKESAIEISNLCTVKNNHYFFSARKGDSGRFAAGIMLV